jgi:hypothetical protein
MPHKSRKQKSKTYFKSKSKFTEETKLRRSKLRKKHHVVGGESRWWPGNWFKKKKSKTANNISKKWVVVKPEDVYPLTNNDNLNKRSTLYRNNFNKKTLKLKPSKNGPYNGDIPQTSQPEFRGVPQNYGYNVPSNKNPNHRRARTPIYEGNDYTPPTTPFRNNQEVVQEQKKLKEALECLEKLNIDPEKLNQITQILESS